MLRFTGDICFTDNYFDIGYGVGSAISNGLNPFKNIEKKEDDIWIGNFECVATDISIHSNYRKDCFRISPSLLGKMNLVDYYGIANNHVAEHGNEAYEQMCEHLNSFCKGCFGSKQQKTIVFEHQTRKIAITAFSLRKDETKREPLYWAFPELNEIEQEYNSIEADVKILYLHWGVEFINYPNTEQRKLAHWLIDLGYDLIIGMHPHILQGYEVYKGKHIFYSLGNFVFNMAWYPSKFSAVVSFDVNTGKVECDYVKIDENYSPYIITASDVPNNMRFEYLNSLFNDNENPESYINKAKKGLKAYRKRNYLSFIKNIHRNNLNIIVNILFDFIKRRMGYGDKK